ncbi:MAG: hypothetical protein ACI90V_006955 [Bacillariaceae sp.]|jgi:hypothetical protein
MIDTNLLVYYYVSFNPVSHKYGTCLALNMRCIISELYNSGEVTKSFLNPIFGKKNTIMSSRPYLTT